MSRQARQRSVTDVYHVIQRGIDHMVIFRDEDDYNMFLNLLRLEVCFTFEVYCYCLMSNHIHLIVKSNKLSFHIGHISSAYAMWFNHKHERSGYLFQDRFRSEVIEEEGYLLRCFRYILKNPVKAGMCKKVSSYKWNSYKYYFNPKPTFITTSFLHFFFDTKTDLQAYLQEEDSEECMDIHQHDLLADRLVKELLKQQLNGYDLSALPTKDQKRILETLKQIPGTRNRQIARITGIGLNIIRRL